jgi:AAA family ATP:ADP antiporter
MFTRLFKLWFGDFEREELKKYLFLGLIFSLIIGVYWTLRPLKDSIFANMIVGFGKSGSRDIYLAWAKVFSLVVLFPIVMFYGKMVDKLKKTTLFYSLAGLYVLLLVFWTLFFANPTYGLANTSASPWRFSGWFWYAFVESFGSIVIALFWALVVDTSTTKSAKHGFALIVMIGQIGGILGPKYLMKIPKLFNTSLASVVGVCGVLVLITALLMWIFFKVTPQQELVGYQAQEKKHEEEPGFLEGLKIMLSHNYLLGIFAILAFFEFIVTVIDFNFKTMTFAYFPDCAQASEYFASYASSVNLVAFLCLFFGINNIQRFLGLRAALCLVPLIIGGAVLTFKLFPLIDVLFYLMVGAKAINYALNGPCIKQLYVPATQEVKYKSQAWIETFGSRTAKASASFANLTKGFFGFELYLSLAVYFSLGLVAAWFFIAMYLANTYDKAIKEKTVVC